MCICTFRHRLNVYIYIYTFFFKKKNLAIKQVQKSSGLLDFQGRFWNFYVEILENSEVVFPSSSGKYSALSRHGMSTFHDMFPGGTKG